VTGVALTRENIEALLRALDAELGRTSVIGEL
jgi:hypothetical protein